MRISNTIQAARFVLALLAALALAGSIPATAQVTTVFDLFSFAIQTGIDPVAIIQARDGNFYGTTYRGGTHDTGTVFKMTQSRMVTTIYSFPPLDASGNNVPGAGPNALMQARDGNLYGTTQQGGVYNAGTVFKITTAGVLTTLYSFTGGNDGANPFASLIQASDGNLYGTTSAEGAYGCGTVFKITTDGVLTTLCSLNGYSSTSLFQASDGNLYGTTSGPSGAGEVLRITTTGTLTNLGACGSSPSALIQATDGNLYGTTGGGIHSRSGTLDPFGTVFKVNLAGGTLTTLYSFSDGSDGAYPSTPFIQASDGDLYGLTAFVDGTEYGTLFKITMAGNLTTLHTFTGSDGSGSYAGLIQATNGLLYGTKGSGGAGGQGVVFRLSGVYPVPVLASISPASTNAASPAFTLKVTGSAFQSFSTVNWKGSPLATTYVSPTQLTAAVPASLITSAGKATATVVTGAGGGDSKSKTFTVLLTTLNLKTVSLTRDTTNNTLTAVVTLSNAGYLAASNTTVTKATLNGSSATNLPQSAGSIGAGSTGTATVIFPGSAGSSGQKVTLKVSGTFTGGTFDGSLNMKLP